MYESAQPGFATPQTDFENLRKEIQLRIAPNLTSGVAEVRICYKNTLADVYQVKNSDLNLVKF